MSRRRARCCVVKRWLGCESKRSTCSLRRQQMRTSVTAAGTRRAGRGAVSRAWGTWRGGRERVRDIMRGRLLFECRICAVQLQARRRVCSGVVSGRDDHVHAAQEVWGWFLYSSGGLEYQSADMRRLSARFSQTFGICNEHVDGCVYAACQVRSRRVD